MAPPRSSVPPPPIDDFVRAAEVVLIELWAEWSGAAFLVGQTLDRFLDSRRSTSVRVGRVDADANPEIADRFRTLPPALLLFRNGALVSRHRGLITVEGLSAWVDRILAESGDAPSNDVPTRTIPPKENAT